MNTRFKSALNRIQADEALISRTEAFLQEALVPADGRKIRQSREKRSPWLFFPDWNSMRGLAALACMVIFLAAGGAGAYNYYQTPVSYISVDINPSIELGINAFGRVVSVQAYNPDGALVLEDLELEGLKVEQAINRLLAAALDKGYIQDDGSTIISIACETDDSERASQLCGEALAGAEASLEAGSGTALLLSDNLPLSMHEEAQSAGITPGKLNLINKLQAVDPGATLDEYRDASIKDIVRDTQAAQGQYKSDPDKGSPQNSNINDDSSGQDLKNNANASDSKLENPGQNRLNQEEHQAGEPDESKPENKADEDNQSGDLPGEEGDDITSQNQNSNASHQSGDEDASQPGNNGNSDEEHPSHSSHSQDDDSDSSSDYGYDNNSGNNSHSNSSDHASQPGNNGRNAVY